MNALFSIFISLFVLHYPLGNCFDNYDDCRNEIISIYKLREADTHYLMCKKSNLNITDNGFLRYNKVFKNNKTEYTSVQIKKIVSIDYFGKENAGWLSIKSGAESVIVQTYNDPDGNIDTMTNEIKIPLMNITTQEITHINNRLLELKILSKN